MAAMDEPNNLLDTIQRLPELKRSIGDHYSWFRCRQLCYAYCTTELITRGVKESLVIFGGFIWIPSRAHGQHAQNIKRFQLYLLKTWISWVFCLFVHWRDFMLIWELRSKLIIGIDVLSLNWEWSSRVHFCFLLTLLEPIEVNID